MIGMKTPLESRASHFIDMAWRELPPPVGHSEFVSIQKVGRVSVY